MYLREKQLFYWKKIIDYQTDVEIKSVVATNLTGKRQPSAGRP